MIALLPPPQVCAAFTAAFCAASRLPRAARICGVRLRHVCGSRRGKPSGTTSRLTGWRPHLTESCLSSTHERDKRTLVLRRLNTDAVTAPGLFPQRRCASPSASACILFTVSETPWLRNPAGPPAFPPPCPWRVAPGIGAGEPSHDRLDGGPGARPGIPLLLTSTDDSRVCFCRPAETQAA